MTSSQRSIFSSIFLVVLSLSAGAADLRAEAVFRERGVHKAKTEDGKYNRVYSVYVSELDWAAMEKYSRSREWDGPGTTTTVCFFNDWRYTPDVTFSGMDFSEHYKESWVGGYWHHPNGNEFFVQYPAKKRELNFY